MKKAFTLAEVLITLTILGVVAAIMVSNIYQNFQKRLTITKLQQAYATLEKAAVNIAFNTGCYGKGLACTGLLKYTDNSSSELTKKFFELGGIAVNEKLLFPDGLYIKAHNYDNIPAKQQAIIPIPYVFKDKKNIGYAVRRESISTNVNDINEKETGLLIYVYTNPNFKSKSERVLTGADKYSNKNLATEIKAGYNVFQFIIYDNFIVEPKTGCSGGRKFPLSVYSNTNDGCNKNSTTNCYGNSCAAKIIKDGWKMNY